MSLLNLMQNFEEKMNIFFELTSGKTVVVWGYGMGGQFIENVFKKYNKQIDVIIDNDIKAHKHNPYFIRSLDPVTTVIIITFTAHEKEIDFLNSLGFRLNKNILLAKDIIFGKSNYNGYISYISYLEENVQGLDFTGIVRDKVSTINSDNHVYGLSNDYSIINIFDNFIIKEDDAIFDLGCGKGGSLVVFYKCGFRKLGGVELDEDLFEILLSNMNLLGIDTSGLLCQDATQLEDVLDDYNFFYMYDPFEGEIFKKVIQNIEESYFRRKRKIILIYAVPVCSTYMMERKLFHIAKKVATSFWGYKETIIYEIPEC